MMIETKGALEAAVCPACGYDNIPGADTCVSCGESLSEEYMAPGQDVEQLGIFNKQIRELNPRQPICLPPEARISEVVSHLQESNVGCVLVVDRDGQLIGIFTEGDAHYKIAGLEKDLEGIRVESYMTTSPSALRPDMPIRQALHLMGLHGFRHLPLVDRENRPVGFVSFRDIVCFIEENFSDAT